MRRIFLLKAFLLGWAILVLVAAPRAASADSFNSADDVKGDHEVKRADDVKGDQNVKGGHDVKGGEAVLWQVTSRAIVKPSTSTRVVWARIYPGAVIKGKLVEKNSRCRKGWVALSMGGFVCAKQLTRSARTEEKIAAIDDPDLLAGAGYYYVTRNMTPAYRNKTDLKKRRFIAKMASWTMLAIVGKVDIGNTTYLKMRRGWLVNERYTQKMIGPIDSIAVDIGDTRGHVVGFAVGTNCEVKAAPQKDARLIEVLTEHTPIFSKTKTLLTATNGYVQLPSGGWAKDSDIARLRMPQMPKQVSPGERWIAVDRDEQLLMAMEGRRLVRVGLCFTGPGGRTKVGHYRIQWKRRLQTFLFQAGAYRVEDVQWVMYYNRQKDIAIHATYWSNHFGRAQGLGCVHLPPEDARWVFEWATPHIAPIESERIASIKNKGSRVVVFRGKKYNKPTGHITMFDETGSSGT